MVFLVYKKFNEPERASELTEILTANGIEFEITEEKDNLDLLYGDKPFGKQYFVKIKGEDFDRTDAVLLALGDKEVATVGKDHYLFRFTDEELFDILSKPDEWNEFDYQLSKKILLDRGRQLKQETIDDLKKQRLNDLARPDEGQGKWIYVGYLFSMLGGVIGVFIGWHLSTYRKTLPNGRQVYGYKEEDRKHGRVIWILGVVVFVISLVIRFSVLQ